MAKAPQASRQRIGEGVRLGLVVSEFNGDITNAMRREALAAARRLGATIVVDVRAPGSYDAPLLAHKALERPDVDAVVVVGAVITGETKHDAVVAFEAARALSDLAIRHGKPVGFGITGPGQTRAMAKARIDRAAWAVESVCKQIKAIRALRHPDA